MLSPYQYVEMSSTPPGAVPSTTQRTEPRTIERDADISTVLAVLEDDDCRAILRATGDEPRSAGELCELCDISSSTVYRKLDALTDAGLLEESVRLSQSGSHSNEYSLAVSALEVSFDGGIELSMIVDGKPSLATAD